MTLPALIVAGVALAVDMPSVLRPLGLSAPGFDPPSIRVVVQLAGNDQSKQEFAVSQTAARYGGIVSPSRGKPEGPTYVQIVFEPSSLQAQRALLDLAIRDLGESGAGVLSGRSEELLPSLEDRMAVVAKEAEGLAAERSALGAALKTAPQTSRLVDERLAQLSIFDPQREPRRAVLVVRLAAELSPMTNDIIIMPGVEQKP